MDSREHPTPLLARIAGSPSPSPRRPEARHAWGAVFGVAVAALFGRSAPVAAETPSSPDAESGSIQVEEHLGWQDPLGPFGLAVVYDRGGRFSAGFGVRPTGIKSHELPPLGVLGRVRLLRFGWGSLGVGATLSRENINHEQLFGQYWTTWSWHPAYRATATVGVEFSKHAWSLRFDAGIGYILNSAQCSAYNSTTGVGGGCDSPGIPAEARTAYQDSRLFPSLTATLGYRFPTPSWPSSPASAVPPGYKSPETALELSLGATVVPALAAAGLLYASISNSNATNPAVAGIATLGLALSFGPSIGHAYAGAPLRAWGGGTLRLLALALGAYIWFDTLVSNSEEYAVPDRSGEVVGVFLMSAAAIWAVYDIGAAPEAARRANARNGLLDVALAPTAIRGQGSPSPGLSVVGRF